MGNQFFEPIEDENGIWGYHYIKKDLVGFLDSFTKYDFLDLEKELVFRNVEFNKFEFESLFEPNLRISLEECSLTMQGECTFQNASLSLMKCDFKTGSFSLKSCDNSSLTIKYSENLNSVYLKDSNNLAVNLNDSIINNLQIYDVDLLSIEIDRLVKTKINYYGCSIRKCYIRNSSELDVTFQETEGDDILLFFSGGKNLTFSNQLGEVDSSKIIFKNIYLSNLTFEEVYILGNHKHLYKIQKLTISETSNIMAGSLYFISLQLSGENIENINISFSTVQFLELSSFKAKKDIVFNLVESDEGQLRLDSAIMKGVEFNPSFLHRFSSIDYSNSTLEGWQLNSFKLVPPEVILKSKMEIEDRINLCRELNALMISQNNRHYATIYRALELELRAKSNDPSISWFDRQVLNLNFWSNVHGTMPQKALFWILLMIVIMFGVINLDLSFQTGIEYEAGFDFLSQNYSYFIKPFTFLSDVENSYKPFHSENMQARFHPITKGFDFLFKIFYAYLLYQFIAGFRKFNK